MLFGGKSLAGSQSQKPCSICFSVNIITQEAPKEYASFRFSFFNRLLFQLRLLSHQKNGIPNPIPPMSERTMNHGHLILPGGFFANQ